MGGGDTPGPTPPSDTLFYKSFEGSATLYVVNAQGLAITESHGLGFTYSDGLVSPSNIGPAPIPKEIYDFTFSTSAATNVITIDGVTYTFTKQGDSVFTVSPSINEFPS